VSVLEMADAYLTFATRGVRMEPIVVTRVTTAAGNVLEENRPKGSRVLDQDEADVVTFCLRQVVEHGTGTGARFGRPVAGKTGTTQRYGDAWFVGYTPTLVAAVWMGYPEGQARAMTDVHGRKVTGGSFPAAIFRRFMQGATAGTDPGDFPTPSSFPGKVLDEPVEFVDPNATTTTSTVAEATTTTGVAAGSTTTTTSGPPTDPTTTTTTAPGPPGHQEGTGPSG
jgi:penicillin-binding protein 1A